MPSKDPDTSKPFFRFLKTTFSVPTVESTTDTFGARSLQIYASAGETATYEKLLNQLKMKDLTKEELKYKNDLLEERSLHKGQSLLAESGAQVHMWDDSKEKKSAVKTSKHQYRLTDGVVYEIFETKRRIDVQIAIQVKNHSINWYFWKEDAKDQYSQDFRDILYKSAALAHGKTSRGCDLYYRGSNAFHVKSMHTEESEAGHNHNHYRMADNLPVEPKDFEEHMRGLNNSRAAMDHFFQEGEIEEIIHEFDVFYKAWIHKDLETGLSPQDQYMALPRNQLDEADVWEFKFFGAQQEPCRIRPDELRVNLDDARKLIENKLANGEITEEKMAKMIEKIDKEYEDLLAYRKVGGSRGLGSERAMTRQIEGSSLPEIKAVVLKDDSLGVEVPSIPKWATSLQEEVAKLIGKMEQEKGTKSVPVKEIRKRFEERKVGTSAPKSIAAEEARNIIKSGVSELRDAYLKKTSSIKPPGKS